MQIVCNFSIMQGNDRNMFLSKCTLPANLSILRDVARVMTLFLCVGPR